MTTGGPALEGPALPPRDDSRALLSLVVPCYNVSAYLADFFRAIERQGRPDGSVELVLVDDGSTDDTLERLEAWAAGTSYPVQVLHKPNGGLSSARNHGIAHASGEWVSFPDPDDVLERGYLRRVLRVLQAPATSSVDLVATNIIFLDDATGELRDEHPLRRRFSRRNRTVSLVESPDAIHLSAATGMLRLDRIRALGLEFDGRIRPNFEDAALIARYLLHADDPRATFVPEARYRYRRRPDSLTGESWAKTEKYTDLLRHGHLALLEHARQVHGSVPRWLQNTILYDLFFYFQADSRVHSPTAALPDAVIAEFFDLVDQIVAAIDPQTIRTYRAAHVARQVREGVLRLREPQQPLDALHVWHVDKEQKLASIKFYWALTLPDVQLFSDGEPVEPVFAKSRSVEYFGRTVMFERILWVPAVGRLTATVDGRIVPVHPGAPRNDPYGITLSRPRPRPSSAAPRRPSGRGGPRNRRRTSPRGGPLTRLRRRLALRRRATRLRSWVTATRESWTISLTLRVSRSSWAKRRFRDAWILVDRDTQAHDNAEHLYRYIRANRPQINAWFALRKDSADWGRLRSEGFRLLEFGSWQHTVALLHCRELVSSQIDQYIVAPLPRPNFPAPKWRFTFLQHGVTKDDLSRWVNPKRPSLVLSVTHDEHEAFVGDGTPYTWTDREVALTGFPRHDALLSEAQNVQDAERDLVVLMPTWRRNLLGDQIDGGNLRSLLPNFWESEFMQSWMGLAASERLRAAAEAQGYQVVFFPHPNLQEYITAERLPPWVTAARYSDVDIQKILARTRVVVTDYSPLAFDAAFIDRAVVYFQFDSDTFFDGSHAYRRGYFDYESQGFGPVCSDLASAEAAIVALVDERGRLEDQYAERIQNTFAHRDQRASERTVRAIQDRRRRYSRWDSAPSTPGASTAPEA